MAEWALEKLEEVWVPIGENLSLTPGLFTYEECHAMLQRVRNYEFYLVSNTKEQHRYVSYITYLVQLMELIRERREVHQFKMRRNEIEGAIIHRAIGILSAANFRFGHDLNLWQTSIDFCKKYNRLIQLSKVLSRMLHFHGDKDYVWIFCAKLEFEVIDAIRTARSIFLLGLKRHGNSYHLHKEYFKFELLAADKTRTRLMTIEQLLKTDEGEQDFDDISATCKLAQLVFKNIQQSRPHDFQLIADCWGISSNFKFARELSDEIGQYMSEQFISKEEYWKVKLTKIFGKEPIETIRDQCNEALSCCQFSPGIFSVLIELLMRQAANFTSKSVAFAYFQLASIIMDTWLERGSVDETKCLQFLRVLMLQNLSKCEEMLSRCLEMNPSSPSLVAFKLELLMARSHEVPKQYVVSLKQNVDLLNSVDFWSLVLKTPQLIATETEWWKSFVLDLMTSAKLSCPSCKLSVKTIALKLILSNQDSQKVKWNEIQRVLALPPVEYSFMTIILSSCDWFDTDQIKWLYEHFCILMGSSCIEVWVDYQKFLSQNRLTKQSYLCNDRAMRQLSKDLVIKYLEAVSN